MVNTKKILRSIISYIPILNKILRKKGTGGSNSGSYCLNAWYDHLYYGKNLWKFLLHGRNYPINRYSHSYHLNLLKKIGFEIVTDIRNQAISADYSKLSKSIKDQYCKEDLSTRTGYILARKPLK